MVREIKHSPQLEISWCVYHPLRRALFNICKLIHFGPVISFYKFEWITGKSVIRDTLSYQNTMLSTCDFLNSFLKKISKQQKTTTTYKLGHFMTCSKKSVRMLSRFFFPKAMSLVGIWFYPDRASFSVHSVQKNLPTKKGVTYITRLHTALHLFPVMITFPLMICDITKNNQNAVTAGVFRVIKNYLYFI